MSDERNVQLVKDFFAAIGNGDVAGLKRLAADDVEWSIPGKDWPLAGTRRGHEGIVDLMRTASETMETTVMEPTKFVVQGDQVMMLGFASGKVKSTGKSWEDDWVFSITVQNGKVRKIREYIDTQALSRAAAPDV